MDKGNGFVKTIRESFTVAQGNIKVVYSKKRWIVTGGLIE